MLLLRKQHYNLLKYGGIIKSKNVLKEDEYTKIK